MLLVNANALISFYKIPLPEPYLKGLVYYPVGNHQWILASNRASTIGCVGEMLDEWRLMGMAVATCNKPSR